MADLSYLDIDFETLKTRLQTVLENNSTFRDYNFEGANMTMIIELLSYLSELTTYYTNKIAKNIYPESADLYNTVHSLSKLQGYKPYGYVAPQLTLDVTVTVSPTASDIPNPGDQIYVPAWFEIDTGLETDDGDAIIYVTNEPTTETIPVSATGTHSFEVSMKQGEYENLSYTGADIIGNKIVLPANKYDYSLASFDENVSMILYVNGLPWERVENFIEYTSQTVDNDDVYQLEYDKYEQYNIRFSSAYNVPAVSDVLEIIIVKTLGADGDIAANTLTTWENINTIPYIDGVEIETTDSYFITNLTSSYNLSEDYISITNSLASTNSSDPETVENIKNSSKNNMASQYRNVTQIDYVANLESSSNIDVANEVYNTSFSGALIC